LLPAKDRFNKSFREIRIMSSDLQSAPASNKMLWVGYVVSALPVLMLLFSGAMKFAKPAAVVEGFAHLGWPDSLALALGIIEVGCTIVYLIPQTAVLGAILLTGYLGGATATHVRIGEGFIGPVLFGVLLWLGLYLRDARIRALIPLRS
jgi:DoxX-like family